MIIQDIRLEGARVIVRAFGTYEELAEMGANVPNHQQDHLAQLDLTVYPCTLQKLDACRHLTDTQKQYVHMLYEQALAAKGVEYGTIVTPV